MTSRKSIYFVNPPSDFPTYFGGEAFAASGFAPAVLAADLVMPTLAGFLGDDWYVKTCEATVQPVDYDTDAEWIAITGKISQLRGMQSIATRFRRAGKRVLIGGPCATLSPELLRPYCDVMVRGEIELIADQLFADLAEGCPKEDYEAPKGADLSLTPMPRWDVYRHDRAVAGVVQTSRGCPFECDFCDVIPYFGRGAQHKPIPNVLAEVDELAKLGFGAVLLADDNFTAYRSKTKELLLALAHRNARRPSGPMFFLAQVSADAAKDTELLTLMSRAGVRYVFIGIETPNEESLAAAKKRQNVKVDLVKTIETFVEHGITVTGGMIVGFDADTPDIFRRQYEFAMQTPVPIFSLGALVAPAATPLHARLSAEGRLRHDDGAEVAGSPLATNIVPRNMTRSELDEGLRWLCRELYAPEAFDVRIERFLALYRDPYPESRIRLTRAPRRVEVDMASLILTMPRFHPEITASWARRGLDVLRRPRSAFPSIPEFFYRYRQLRHMYAAGQIWEPQPSAEPSEQELIPLGRGRLRVA